MLIKLLFAILFSVSLLLPPLQASQPKPYSIHAGVATILGDGMHTPFWLTANRGGRFLPGSNAAAAEMGFFVEADTGKVFDYHFGMQVFSRLGGGSELWLQQIHAGISLYDLIELRVGLWEGVIGSCEPLLSSGSIIWSGNARPVPRIQLGTPGYVKVPYTRGYAEVSGLLAHGRFIDDRYVDDVLLHHKNIYIKLGGPLPVNIHYGFNHYAQWGGQSPDYDKPFPSDLDAYYRIFFNRAGDTDIPGTPPTWENHKFGNTLGSRNYGIDLQLQALETGLYMQDVFEDGSGLRRQNFPDGLWGAYLRFPEKPKLLQTVVYEFLHTKHQSGPTHNDQEGNVIGGNDNYFNHAIYQSGWTNYQYTIGTPLITSPVYNAMERFGGLPAHRLHNNRVVAHHIGIKGFLGSKMHYRGLVTYSRNYGRHSETFEAVAEQLSLMLEVSQKLPQNGLEIGLTLAADRGEPYGNNYGIMLKLNKQWSFNEKNR